MAAIRTWSPTGADASWQPTSFSGSALPAGGNAGVTAGRTASAIPTGYTPEASAAALTAQNDLAKLLMSIADSVDEQGKKQAQGSSGGAATLRTNNFHAQIDMSGVQKQSEKIASEQEAAVNAQLTSGKGFGTTGSAGKTSEQLNALSTDDLIKHLNDTLSGGIKSFGQTAFGIGDFKTEASALLNSIRDTTHAEGSKDYKPGLLDRVEERLIKTSDDINSVTDEAMHTTDPKRLNELLARMTELQIEFKRVLKEQEKLEAIARLVT
ncbi:MAG: hypothetical protein H7123_01050, partial [Thermoleophilia bacterium]|nr:hypothetical protein [Thermoleophilia bacterium]